MNLQRKNRKFIWRDKKMVQEIEVCSIGELVLLRTAQDKLTDMGLKSG